MSNRFAPVPGRVEYSIGFNASKWLFYYADIKWDYLKTLKTGKNKSEIDKNRILQDLSANIASSLNKEIFNIFKLAYNSILDDLEIY